MMPTAAIGMLLCSGGNDDVIVMITYHCSSSCSYANKGISKPFLAVFPAKEGEKAINKSPTSQGNHHERLSVKYILLHCRPFDAVLLYQLLGQY